MESTDWVIKLCEVMAALRHPQTGCPWDLEQSHESLLEYLIEESHEYVDAVLAGNDGEMADELGDVLLQVVFHCQLAQEQGRFDLQQVARACAEKLIRRHPHVFGDETAADAEAVLKNWEQIKNAERGHARPSRLDGIPSGLSPLLRAMKLQRRAAKDQFDWPDADGARDKLNEELAELDEVAHGSDPEALQDEFGDVLFCVLNVGRKLGCDPFLALAHANRKFDARYRMMESLAREAGQELQALPLAEQEKLWQQGKQRLTGSPERL